MIALVTALLVVASAGLAQAPGQASQLATTMLQRPGIAVADLQWALIWTGDYNGMVDGKGGRATHAALTKWIDRSAAIGSPSELAGRLASEAGRELTRVGWAVRHDAASGLQFGVPTALLTRAAREGAGAWTFQDADGRAIYRVSTAVGSDGLMRAREAALNSVGREFVNYEVTRDDRYVAAGRKGEVWFYLMGRRSGERHASFTFAAEHDDARMIRIVVVAMANSFTLERSGIDSGPVRSAEASPEPGARADAEARAREAAVVEARRQAEETSRRLREADQALQAERARQAELAATTRRAEEQRLADEAAERARRATPPRNPFGVAVIIGNRSYRPPVPAVSFARRDADAMKRVVVDVLGYSPDNVIDLQDATLAQLNDAFGSAQSEKGLLWQYLNPGKSEVFVFYSGHGGVDQGTRQGYILPVDGSPNSPSVTGYPLQQLYDNLSKLDAQSVTVLLDACFSGESAAGMLIRSASPVGIAAEMPRPKGKLTVLTAASGDQLASWDEQAKHGLFTEYLLRAVYGEGPDVADGRLTAGMLKGWLDGSMTLAARRTFRRVQTSSLSGNDAATVFSWPDNKRPQRPAIK